MNILLFISISFISNILFFIFETIQKKHGVLFLINIIKSKIKNELSRKIHINEIINIIEYLNSYIKSGLQPSQALLIIAKNKKWTSFTKKNINQVINYYSQGMSFTSSINNVVLSLEITENNKYIILFLTSLKIGCSSGGNIISILDKTKNKLVNKIKIQNKIRATTAQIRFQSIIISLAPLLISLIIWLISPSYILFFINEPTGNIFLIIMILLNLIGFYFLKLISRII